MAQKMANLSRAIKGVYALTPDCLDTEDLLLRVRQVLKGGVQILQYRNKIANPSLRMAQAQALRTLTRVFEAALIINDDAQLAAAVDADGVHLGKTDGDITSARTVLGVNKLIGVSCYNQLQLAHDAETAGADYVAFGAFYPSTVKPNAVVAGIDLLRSARSQLSIPIVAIGGINMANGAVLVQAGADALAVISAVFDAADIQLATKNLSQLFRK